MKDKLFLLSATEVEEYLPDEESRICRYKDAPCYWWLRSPSNYRTITATYVDYDGTLYCKGESIHYANAVRPALYLNLDYLNSLKRNKEGYVMFANREWIVLDEETGLLLVKNVVCKHYFAEFTNNYELSEISFYMNNELLHEMFSKEERKMIMNTVIDGEESYPAN